MTIFVLLHVLSKRSELLLIYFLNNVLGLSVSQNKNQFNLVVCLINNFISFINSQKENERYTDLQFTSSKKPKEKHLFKNVLIFNKNHVGEGTNQARSVLVWGSKRWSQDSKTGVGITKYSLLFMISLALLSYANLKRLINVTQISSCYI